MENPLGGERKGETEYKSDQIINFTLKYINSEWWQQKQTNIQNNINRVFLISGFWALTKTNKLNSVID